MRFSPRRARGLAGETNVVSASPTRLPRMKKARIAAGLLRSGGGRAYSAASRLWPGPSVSGPVFVT